MAAVAAVHPRIGGYPLTGLTSEEIDRSHGAQLNEMFQSFEIKEDDIQEIRRKLEEEGKNSLEIDAAILEHVEKIQNLSRPEGIPVDMLMKIVAEYRTNLSKSVECAAGNAIRNLSIGFNPADGHISQLSLKIWFDGTTPLRTLKDLHAQNLEKTTKETVAQEEPVYQLSARVVSRENLEAELEKLSGIVIRNFQTVVTQYPLPGRMIIEWKVECPEENQQSFNLDCEILPLARGLAYHYLGKINPEEAPA